MHSHPCGHVAKQGLAFPMLLLLALLSGELLHVSLHGLPAHVCTGACTMSTHICTPAHRMYICMCAHRNYPLPHKQLRMALMTSSARTLTAVLLSGVIGVLISRVGSVDAYVCGFVCAHTHCFRQDSGAAAARSHIVHSADKPQQNLYVCARSGILSGLGVACLNSADYWVYRQAATWLLWLDLLCCAVG